MEETVLVRPRGADFSFEVVSRHVEWYEAVGYEPLSSSTFEFAAGLADVVIDIGAHAGWYSVLAAKANPRTRVIAVEGAPETAELCRRNCERIVPGRVEVLSAVFSAHEGVVEYHITDASDNSSLSGHPASPTLEVIERPSISGGQLGIAPGQRVLIKVDVEGHEIGVLEGLQGVIEAAAEVRLLIEFNPICLRRAGSTPSELLERLHELGFSLHSLDDATGRWASVATGAAAESICPDERYVNLLCARGAQIMGVAVALHSDRLGGAERTALERMAQMLRSGHLVHAYVPGKGPLWQELREQGVTLLDAPLPWWVSPESVSDWTTTASRGIAVLVADLSVNRPDLVLTVTATIPQAAMAARGLGLPHVWDLHEFIDLDHDLHGPVPVRQLGEFITTYSTAVIVNSRAVGEHVLGPGDWHAVPPLTGAAVAAIAPADPPRAIPRVLGVFSSLHRNKGQRDVLRAFALLLGEGRDLELRLYGTGEESEFAHLRGLAEDLAIGERVRFAGQVSEPLGAMADVDIVVVPSHREAFGRVPIEAIMVGRPVVYCRAGGTDEYMGDGTTGIGCQPHDPVDLARALRRFLDDPASCLRIAQDARPVLLRWLDQADPTATFQGILADVASQWQASEWPRLGAEQLIGSAARACLKSERDLGDRLHLLEHERHLLELDRAAVDADRQRLDALRAEEELHREALESSLRRALAEVDQLHQVQATRRYRALFGWRDRIPHK